MKKILVFTFLSAVLCIHAFAEKTVSVKDVRYLNFDAKDNARYVRWDARADWKRIEHWAVNRGITAFPDRGPVTDKEAAYVSPYGSEVILGNLNANASYTLYIDFAVFDAKKSGILSKLVISADGRKIASVNFGELPRDALFELVIPRDLYYDGTVTLRFDEYATSPGVWGVWDMVLSTAGLPTEPITPKKEIPSIKDPAAKVAEPAKKEKRKTATSDSKEPAKSAEPAKEAKKQPEIVEPPSAKEPEIREPEAVAPKEPAVPAEPGDIRDGK